MDISESWKWIIGTAITAIVSVSGALGINRLLLNRQKHNSDIANADINFDQYTFRVFVNEVKELKGEVKEAKEEIKDLRKELNSQMVKNATLEAENKHLKESYEKLEKENVDLRDRERILNQQVSSLTNMVAKLQAELDGLKKGAVK